MARTSLFARLQRIAATIRMGREDAAWSRRSVLVGTGTTVAAAMFAGCSPGDGDGDTDGDTDGHGDGLRVAIVGGGMAGLHCAYRLQQAGIEATVYEASARTGGRMYTARGMFPDNQLAELGGEFIDTGHLTLQMLAQEFGIALDERAAGDGPDTVKDVWWIDGVAVPESTVVEQFSAVASLMLDLVEMADSDDAAYEMLDNIAMSDWLADNVPVATYPELNAILNAAYRGEYGLETDQQSVLNLLYLIGSDDPDPFRIFGVSDEAFHTHDGSDTFPATLAAELGDAILLEHRLVAARDGEGGAYLLRFETPDGELEVEADHVVFALPFTLLREVDLEGLTLGDDKRTIIAELGYGTNAKVMGAFANRVWRTQYDSTGSVTSDAAFQQAWDTSIGQIGDHGIITSFLGGERGVAAGQGEAEAWYADVLVSGLEAVFPGVSDVYVEGSAVRMHWPTQPFTKGSYACYRPGQWAYYGIEGEREGNLHFCGEHTSLEFQGYMEGAAETGGLVAAAILEDVGMRASGLYGRWLDFKRAVPQPHLDGRLSRPRWSTRRRTITATLTAMLAKR